MVRAVVAVFPLGGLTWQVLNYLLGFARLGHEVYFVEDSGAWEKIYDPARNDNTEDLSYGLAYLARAMEAFGFGERWCYAAGERWHGIPRERLRRIAASADLLVTLGRVEPVFREEYRCARNVYIDADPGFTQLYALHDDRWRRFLGLHDLHLTFGVNIGSPTCPVPTAGLDWRPTRPPIALDQWPAAAPPAAGRYTTVMQWDSYPPERHGELELGTKSTEFLRFLDLPRVTGEPLEVAVLGADDAPALDPVRAAGWSVRDGRTVSKDLWTMRDYVQKSRAEFTVAKGGYVHTRSGWFSERSAAYLATGRPVITQDTGFTTWLPAGEGLLAFSDPDEAAGAIRAVNADYGRHAAGARRIAETHFGSDRVLRELLDRIA